MLVGVDGDEDFDDDVIMVVVAVVVDAASVNGRVMVSRMRMAESQRAGYGIYMADFCGPLE